ncbi:MAG: hypothetical protein M3400_03570 [Actinomycetota bacterium]|nr:hypothetical protein [Actinomycetota bacterium]
MSRYEQPGTAEGQAIHGDGQFQPPSTPGRQLAGGIGEVFIAAGGVLFFIASFLTWISLDLGAVLRCDEFSDPVARANCETGFGAGLTDSSANAWDFTLGAAATVIMILLTLTAVGMGLRANPVPRRFRQLGAAAVLVVDVILLTFVAVFDLSSAGAVLTEDALGGRGAAASGGLSGLSLGLGFWLAVAGLLVAHAGMVVGQRVLRSRGQPSS